MASALVFVVLGALVPNLAHGAACHCKYAGTTLPETAGEKAGNPLYGTSCDVKWDGLPGTVYYKNDTECPASKDCEKGCNYRHLEWCYVERGCTGAAHFNTTIEGEDLAYSYDMCGNPYCWDPWGWEEGCPGGKMCDPHACHCKYAGTTLPVAAGEEAGNPLYGTSCDVKWDSLPGTVYYKSEAECGGMECQKGCNYLQLEWCYVEPGCHGAAHFNSTLPGMAMEMAYSYDMCGNPYCWDPWGWEEGCPGSDHCLATTCGEVKAQFRANECCGNPSKSFVIGR